METPPGSETRAISADRVDGGVIVTFHDGRCALFSSALLYSMIDRAEVVLDADLSED